MRDSINDIFAHFWLYIDIGNLFFKIRELDSAIHYYRISNKGFTKALANASLKDKKGIQLGISVSLENIALCHIGKGEIEKAIANYKESLRYRWQIGDKVAIQYTTTKLGEAFLYANQFDSALYYLENSLNFEVEGIKDEYQLAQYNDYKSKALALISNIYYLRNKLDLAEYYFTLAFKSLEKNNNPYRLFDFYFTAAYFYFQHNNLQKAEENAKQALLYAKSDFSTSNFAEATKLLYNIALLKKDNVNALKYLEKAYNFLDSSSKVSDLMAIEFSKLASDLEDKIDRVQKLMSEKRIEEQRTSILWILVGSLVIILTLMGIILYNFYQKRELTKAMNQTLTEKNEELSGMIHQLEESRAELKVLNEQLMQTNIELERSNDAKNKLFSIIAHDLRNLAGPLKNTSNLMTEEYESFDEQQRKQFLVLMNDSANRLNSLLQDLLVWASAITENITLNKEKVNLRILANNSIDLFHVYAEEKSIELINQVPEEIEVFCDLNMISTVFRNSIHNAIKFTNEDGHVTISATQEDPSFIKIAVSDDGVGMPSSLVNSVFVDVPFNLSFGTKGEKGAGLGLRICKEFIQIHNGNIWFESEPNKGTTAFFTLPNSTI
jgi:signal transduction histidine kinase